MKQHKIFEKQYGEVFICSEQTHGAMEVLQHFKGKLIATFGGGCKKLFVTEEQTENQGVVSCLHAEEYDDFDQTFQDTDKEVQSPEQVLESFNQKGQIKSITSGKRNMFLLNNKGQLFSYGYGDYGALGQGGITFLQTPQIIPSLKDRYVTQISCGEYHSLALTNIGDVYAWGRGFEGQLGISANIVTASTPKYLKFFHNNPVVYISCGAYHSLAITNEKKLYGWGEARLGQLSFKKRSKVSIPELIIFPPFKKDHQSQFNLNQINYDYKNNYVPEISIACGGFGHTVCLSELGDIYVFGFNIKGQLGCGDRKTRFTPEMLKRDILNQKLPKFIHIACGYFNNIAITETGKIMSWGFGNLGQKNETIQDLPRLVETHVEGRSFQAVFMNQSSALLFCPLRVASIRPFSGPSLGGTMISLIGTGFKETGKQIIRLKFAGYQRDINASFEEAADCFHAITPNFESFKNPDELPIQWPQTCQIELSLDGIMFTKCEHDFLIYNSKIQVNSLNIKCASVKGGLELQLHVNNIDEQTALSLEYLIVGFQLKKRNQREHKHEHSQTSKVSRSEKQEKKEVKTINPLDSSLNDVELDKENWKCMPGFYEKGTILCMIPNVEQYLGSQHHFNVDISLNGQQFTGYPSSFKFYNIQNTLIFPNSGSPQGGLIITAQGDTLFDTLQKKVKFSCQFGDRLIDPVWDQVNKQFSFVAPPLVWLFGGKEHTEEQIQTVMDEMVIISLSLNGVEWMELGTFNYTDFKVDYIGQPQQFNELNEWIHSEKKAFSSLNNTVIETEKENQLNEMAQCFKKAGQYITINGSGYKETQQILAQFKCQNISLNCVAQFVTSQKVIVCLPEINLSQGIHEVTTEICFNGQQFSISEKTFKYLSFGEGMNEKDKLKFEDDFNKQLKKKK